MVVHFFRNQSKKCVFPKINVPKQFYPSSLQFYEYFKVTVIHANHTNVCHCHQPIDYDFIY